MTSSSLPPGSTVGIVGGGQLGRMLCIAAHQLGYRTAVLTGGDKDTPAGSVADVEIALAFDDDTAVEWLVSEADVITWEFENVDVALADVAISAGIPVHPSPAIVTLAQDRRLEKEALTNVGVPVTPWRPAATRTEFSAAVQEIGTPVIAKAARNGYDGKGQVRLDPSTDLDSGISIAWDELGPSPVIVEAVVEFTREVSVVIARGADGELAHHGVMENHHENHILDTTMVPARLDPSRSNSAIDLARRIAIAWQLVGVMCVEMFDTPDGLVVNEVAPRPHNSGHCTIEAATASQFEQQVRAVCGLPLGNGDCRPAAMAQLLGDLWAAGEPDWNAALARPGIHLHLYGKAEARAGRKMGHMTCVGADPRNALAEVVAAREALTR